MRSLTGAKLIAIADDESTDLIAALVRSVRRMEGREPENLEQMRADRKILNSMIVALSHAS